MIIYNYCGQDRTQQLVVTVILNSLCDVSSRESAVVIFVLADSSLCVRICGEGN